MHPQGNIFIILAFCVWIPIALWGARRWPPAKAASLLLLIPLLFLPERTGFKLPGIPEFEKEEIAVLWLLIAVLLFHRDRLRALRLSNKIKLSIFLFLGGAIATVLLNSDPISNGSVYLPGHVPYDAVHLLISGTFNVVLPFVLAAAMFNGRKDLRVLFRALVGAALIYSVFQIIELRFSPQLHNWTYGYHQSHYQAVRRGEGFRPMVFMHSGLALAMFTTVAVLAAAAMHKAKVRVFRLGAGWATAYLWLILLLSKSLAAFLYSLVAVPLISFFTPKTQFRAAVLLALAVLAYPVVRGAGLVPVEAVNELVIAQFGEERSASLMTRFNNEEKLLERANERSLFGWGAYCRPCIYDAKTNEQLSIRDGDWIITVGGLGFVGFFGKYLLLLLPIFVAARKQRHVPWTSDRRLLSGLALIVGFSAVDLLPNGNFNYLVFVLSGALFGCCRGAVLEASMKARSKRQQGIDRRSVEYAPAAAVAPQRLS